MTAPLPGREGVNALVETTSDAFDYVTVARLDQTFTDGEIEKVQTAVTHLGCFKLPFFSSSKLVRTREVRQRGLWNYLALHPMLVPSPRPLASDRKGSVA